MSDIILCPISSEPSTAAFPIYLATPFTKVLEVLYCPISPANSFPNALAPVNPLVNNLPN